jgi:hypothetical protein
MIIQLFQLFFIFTSSLLSSVIIPGIEEYVDKFETNEEKELCCCSSF